MKEKKKKNKRLLIILSIIILILIICISLLLLTLNKSEKKSATPSKTKIEDKIYYNKNKKVTEDKNVNDITFTNITCTFDGNYSLLEYTITNHTNETINLGEYEIIIKDKEGNTLANIAPTLDQEIQPEESLNTGNSIDIDLRQAYEIELVIE